MANKINIQDASFMVNLGVSAEERKEKQEIFLCLEMNVEIFDSTESDDINDTVDYSVVNKKVKELLSSKEYNLVEKLADEVAGLVLSEFNVNRLVLEVKKPSALLNAKYCSVIIERDSE